MHGSKSQDSFDTLASTNTYLTQQEAESNEVDNQLNSEQKQSQQFTLDFPQQEAFQRAPGASNADVNQQHEGSAQDTNADFINRIIQNLNIGQNSQAKSVENQKAKNLSLKQKQKYEYGLLLDAQGQKVELPQNQGQQSFQCNSSNDTTQQAITDMGSTSTKAPSNDIQDIQQQNTAAQMNNQRLEQYHLMQRDYNPLFQVSSGFQELDSESFQRYINQQINQGINQDQASKDNGIKQLTLNTRLTNAFVSSKPLKQYTGNMQDLKHQEFGQQAVQNMQTPDSKVMACDQYTYVLISKYPQNMQPQVIRQLILTALSIHAPKHAQSFCMQSVIDVIIPMQGLAGYGVMVFEEQKVGNWCKLLLEQAHVPKGQQLINRIQARNMGLKISEQLGDLLVLLDQDITLNSSFISRDNFDNQKQANTQFQNQIQGQNSSKAFQNNKNLLLDINSLQSLLDSSIEPSQLSPGFMDFSQQDWVQNYPNLAYDPDTNQGQLQNLLKKHNDQKQDFNIGHVQSYPNLPLDLGTDLELFSPDSTMQAPHNTQALHESLRNISQSSNGKAAQIDKGNSSFDSSLFKGMDLQSQVEGGGFSRNTTFDSNDFQDTIDRIFRMKNPQQQQRGIHAPQNSKLLPDDQLAFLYDKILEQKEFQNHSINLTPQNSNLQYDHQTLQQLIQQINLQALQNQFKIQPQQGISQPQNFQFSPPLGSSQTEQGMNSNAMLSKEKSSLPINQPPPPPPQGSSISPPMSPIKPPAGVFPGAFQQQQQMQGQQNNDVSVDPKVLRICGFKQTMKSREVRAAIVTVVHEHSYLSQYISDIKDIRVKVTRDGQYVGYKYGIVDFEDEKISKDVKMRIDGVELAEGKMLVGKNDLKNSTVKPKVLEYLPQQAETLKVDVKLCVYYANVRQKSLVLVNQESSPTIPTVDFSKAIQSSIPELPISVQSQQQLPLPQGIQLDQLLSSYQSQNKSMHMQKQLLQKTQNTNLPSSNSFIPAYHGFGHEQNFNLQFSQGGNLSPEIIQASKIAQMEPNFYQLSTLPNKNQNPNR